MPSTMPEKLGSSMGFAVLVFGLGLAGWNGVAAGLVDLSKCRLKESNNTHLSGLPGLVSGRDRVILVVSLGSRDFEGCWR